MNVCTLSLAPRCMRRTAKGQAMSEFLMMAFVAFMILFVAIQMAALGREASALGQLSYQAVLHRDYPLIMAVFTLSAFMTLAGILVADFLYTIVDPRITYEKRATA